MFSQSCDVAESCTHHEFGVRILIEIDPGEDISCVLLYFEYAGTVGELLQVHFVVHSTGSFALWGKNMNIYILNPLLKNQPSYKIFSLKRYFVFCRTEMCDFME